MLCTLLSEHLFTVVDPVVPGTAGADTGGGQGTFALPEFGIFVHIFRIASQ